MARDRKWSSLAWGIALVIAGTLFWLDQLQKIDVSLYLKWWPLILTAFGLANLAERRIVGGIVLILLSLAFLPRLPLMPRFDQIIGLWPLMISAAGVTLLVQATKPATADPRAATFHSVAVMGGSGRVVGSSEVVAGDAVAVMGGCEIDFSSAEGVREAVIDVVAFWGGIGIIVPRGWRVESRVMVLLGGMSGSLAQYEPGAPTVVVRGAVIMGGIEYSNPKESAS